MKHTITKCDVCAAQLPGGTLEKYTNFLEMRADDVRYPARITGPFGPQMGNPELCERCAKTIFKLLGEAASKWLKDNPKATPEIRLATSYKFDEDTHA